MAWKSNYKAERKIPIGDIAEELRRSVNMEDVLAFYLPKFEPRMNRIRCPLHDGTDRNFAFSHTGYTCFVCHESGDVITFVQRYLGLPNRVEAIKRMNDDMHLNLPIDRPVAAVDAEALRRRREANEAREAESRRREKDLADLWLKWADCDKAKREAPVSSDEYASAVRSIDYISYLIDSYPPKEEL